MLYTPTLQLSSAANIPRCSPLLLLLGPLIAALCCYIPTTVVAAQCCYLPYIALYCCQPPLLQPYAATPFPLLQPYTLQSSGCPTSATAAQALSPIYWPPLKWHNIQHSGSSSSPAYLDHSCPRMVPPHMATQLLQRSTCQHGASKACITTQPHENQKKLCSLNYPPN